MPAGLIRADELPETGFVGSGGEEAAVQCRCESPTPTVPGSSGTIFPELAEILEDERAREAAGRSKLLLAGRRARTVGRGLLGEEIGEPLVRW